MDASDPPAAMTKSEEHGRTETRRAVIVEASPLAAHHAFPGLKAIGMIEVRGPNVFKGYWRMPEKTKSEFRDDGFFITGDLGKIDPKGYVHILGRGKDLVISGGFNVYPKEIESEIDAMPGVIESAVIGVPHADFGEGVTAVVVCNKGADVTEAGGGNTRRYFAGDCGKRKTSGVVLRPGFSPEATTGPPMEHGTRGANTSRHRRVDGI